MPINVTGSGGDGAVYVDTSTSFDGTATLQGGSQTRGTGLRPRERYVDIEEKSDREAVIPPTSFKPVLAPPPSVTAPKRGDWGNLHGTDDTVAGPKTEFEQPPQPLVDPVEAQNSYQDGVKSAIYNNPDLNEQEKGIAYFNFLYPQGNVDTALNPDVDMSKVKQAIINAKQTTLEDIKKDYPNWALSEPDSKSFEGNYQDSFLSALKELNVPQDQWGKYQYALYHPEERANVDLDTFDKIQAKMAEHAKESGFIFPEGFNPNSAEIDKQMSEDYDSTFENLLSQYGEDNNLSDDQISKLRRKHYTKEADPVLTELESKAIDLVRKGYGVPDSVQIEPDSNAFEGQVKANFRVLSEQLFRSKIKGMPTDQKNALLAAMENYPNFPEGTPEDIQNMAKAIVNEAADQIRSKYGFPLTWQPSGPVLMKSPTEALDTLDALKDMQAAAEKYAASLPEGDSKMQFMDFLREIGKQISKYQELIYEMEFKTTEKNTKLGQAYKETMIFQKDQEEKAAKELAEKQAKMDEKTAKMGKIGLAMKILTPIMIAISIAATILTAGALGPVCVALIVAMSTFSAADMISKEVGGPDLMQNFVKYGIGGIGIGLAALTKELGGNEDWQNAMNIVGKVITILLIVAAMVLSRNVGFLGGAAAATGVGMAACAATLFATSGIVQDIVLASYGGEDKANDDQKRIAMFVGLGVNTSVQMGVSIGTTIASVPRAAAQAEKITSRLAEVSAEIAKTSIKSTMTMTEKIATAAKLAWLNMQKIALTMAKVTMDNPIYATYKLRAFLNLGVGALEVTDVAFTVKLNELKNDVVRIKQRKETTEETLQDAIESLRTAMKGLQTLLEQLSQILADTGEAQVKKYRVGDSLFQG